MDGNILFFPQLSPAVPHTEWIQTPTKFVVKAGKICKIHTSLSFIQRCTSVFDQSIWLHTRQHKENDGPVLIFAQPPSSLFISRICLPRCYHEASNFTGTLLLLSQWLNSGAPGPPTSHQVRGHVQVSPQRAVIELCGPVLPLLSLSLWLLLCSEWAYRRANSGVLSSPFPPPPSIPLPLSLSLSHCFSSLLPQLATSLAYSALLYLIDEILKLKRSFD